MKEITSEASYATRQVTTFLKTIQSQAYRCNNITQNLLNLIRKFALTTEKMIS